MLPKVHFYLEDCFVGFSVPVQIAHISTSCLAKLPRRDPEKKPPPPAPPVIFECYWCNLKYSVYTHLLSMWNSRDNTSLSHPQAFLQAPTFSCNDFTDWYNHINSHRCLSPLQICY